MRAAAAQLGVTWGISATRVVNNKHHVADVLAGMLLGGTVATVFALRAIPRVRRARRASALPLILARQYEGHRAAVAALLAGTMYTSHRLCVPPRRGIMDRAGPGVCDALGNNPAQPTGAVPDPV